MFRRFICDIRKYFRFSIFSAKAQLKAEVANSYLNWVWWVLEPLCFMLIYIFIFGYVFNSREKYFPVFIFIGLSMWNFFKQVLTSSVKMVKSNQAIVAKVYLPKYILILIKVWVSGFKMMISFGIVVLMMFAFQIPVTWNVLYILPILLTLFIFTFGCSCYLLHFGVYVEDLSNVINIVLRLLLYLTGIFYDVAKRIPVYGGKLNRYNPIAFLITSARQCLIYEGTPDCRLLLLWLIVSLVIAVAGIFKIYKEENNYIKSI